MSIYNRLFGFKPIINASGTMTRLGGSLMPIEVVEAMTEAASEWVQLPELLDAVGERIAELAGVEACFISSGCAACLTLATAACLTGKDSAKMAQLPHTEGVKNELLWQRGHYPAYAAQFTAAGAKLVIVESDQTVLRLPNPTQTTHLPALRTLGISPEAVEKAITEQTFAVAYSLGWFLPQDGLVSLREVCDIAHDHGLPVIVDAASELPYLTNGKFDLGYLNRVGADIVCFSGGKAMRGPNDTGIALGRKEIVEAAKMQANPARGIGRGFKVSKEQVVGLLAAIERCTTLDWGQVMAEEARRADAIIDALADTSSVTVMNVFPDETGLPVRRVWLQLDEQALGITAEDVISRLRLGDPSIYLRHGYEELGIVVVDVQVLRSGEAQIVAQRLREVLEKRD